jgi:photosystem II stability/assembly factor-like uncharacterized protein
MHKRMPSSFSRSRLLWAALSVAAGGFAILPGSATAAIDLLQRPAYQTIKASKGMLLAVARAADRIVAAGERGIIIYSDDQGASWKQASVPVSVTLTSLRFVSPALGWAAGHDGVILRTDDGGNTWRKQFDGNSANSLMLASLEARVIEAKKVLQGSPENARATAESMLEAMQNALEDAKASTAFGPSMPILGLWFKNKDEGLAVGAFGQFFHTRDGGKSWDSWGTRLANPDSLHLNTIEQLANGDLMVAGEAGKLRRSRDAGESWETLDTGYQGHLYGSLALANGHTLLAFGFAGRIFRSSDDGRSWTPLPKLTNKPIVAGLMLANSTVLLVASDGRQLISRDQGQTFVLSPSPSGRPVAAVLGHALPKAGLLLVGVGGARSITLDSAPD